MPDEHRHCAHRLERVRFKRIGAAEASGEGYQRLSHDGLLLALYDATGEDLPTPTPPAPPLAAGVEAEVLRACGPVCPYDEDSFWRALSRDLALARQLEPGRDARPLPLRAGGLAFTEGYPVAPDGRSVGEQEVLVDVPTEGALVRDVRPARLGGTDAYAYDISVDGGASWVAVWDPFQPLVATASGALTLCHLPRGENPRQAFGPGGLWFFEPAGWRGTAFYSAAYPSAGDALAAAEAFEAGRPAGPPAPAPPPEGARRVYAGPAGDYLDPLLEN